MQEAPTRIFKARLIILRIVAFLSCYEPQFEPISYISRVPDSKLLIHYSTKCEVIAKYQIISTQLTYTKQDGPVRGSY